MQKSSRICVRSFSSLIVLLALLALVGESFAEVRTTIAPQVRITKPLSNAKRTTLFGHTPKALNRASKLGRVDPGTPAQHLILALKSSQQQEREARRVIDEQQDKRTVNFHQWMTPEEFGAHFGVHDSDVENVKAWLSSQGFSVESVAKSKRAIQFSGTIGQLENAFQTEMHYFLMPNGETHVSNDRNITVPEALSPVIAGIPTLNNLFRRTHQTPVAHYSRMKLGPKFSNGANCGNPANNDCFVGPGDFATIYNTAPLLAAGINGSGVTIAIVGRSDILMSDVQTYRQLFNLPVNDPIFIHAGQDNGIEPGDDGESDLDVEISGGIAPNATIKFVIGTPTFLVDGITNSIQYIIENNVADIMSTSYGDCEANEGAGGNAFNSQMFEQAAAQGISIFVADGDNGPAECDDSNDNNEVLGYAASAEGATPYGVSVGGTQFNEGAGTYWSNNNNPLNLSSALSYIPEYPWNEAKGANPTSTPPADLAGLWSGSGGISAYYLTPSWQRGPGVPTVDPPLVLGNGAPGSWITGVTITNPGTGYTSTPSVTFSGGGCAAEPQAVVTIAGGSVNSFAINYGTQGGTLRGGQGFGCTSAPTIAFTAAPAGGTTATAIVSSIGQMQGPPPLVSGAPHRYTPDVSLNAASDHDGTFFCSEGVCEIGPTGALLDAGLVGGTSVAAPSMAGIQALINQANGGRQGMPAYIYYTLAMNQNTANCNSSGPPAPGSNCAFQDVTVGNNLICGLSGGSCSTSAPAAKIGFNASTGYDMATGLGSVNAANLSAQWSTVTFFSSNSSLNLSQTSFVHGTPVTLSGLVAPGSGSGTPTGDVAFIVSQGAIGEPVDPNSGALSGTLAFTTLQGDGSYSAMLNNLPGGTYNVTARYGGDSTFGSSYSTPVQVTVQPEGSGLTLTSSVLNGSSCTLTTASTFAYGADIWIDAQVAGGSGTGVPTGTVTLNEDGNLLATLNLDANGHAFTLAGPISNNNCLYLYDYSNVPTFTGGSHSITASYSGDQTYNASTATPIPVTVTSTTPSIGLAAGATLITAGFNDQLTATINVSALTGYSIGSTGPTGTVTFTDTTTATVLGTAPVITTSVTTTGTGITTFTSLAVLQTTGITVAGPNAITATYSGDTNWATATSSAVTVTVGTFTTATATAVTSNSNPTTLNGRPTFTASVSGGTGPTSGTVTFYDGTNVLGTGTVGSGHTTTLRLASGSAFFGGAHNITATFGGVSGTFAPSTSPVLVENVTLGTTTNVLSAKTVGKSTQTFTFASVITPSNTNATYQPTANVLFFDGATQIGSAPLTSVSSGNGGYGLYTAVLAVNNLTNGTHPITAQYPGDVNYTGSTSAVQNVVVGDSATVSWTTPAPITYGTPLSSTQLDATASIPGTFVYSPAAGTVLNAGTQPLSVTFTPADYTDYGPQPGSTSLVVNQAPQTITFTINAPATAAYQSSFTVAATGGASGNPVTFTSAGACTNVGATYTMISGTGNCSVLADQAGNSNYAAATEATQTTAATQIGQTITFTINAPASAAYNSNFTVAATASSGDTVVFTSSGVCTNVGATYTMTSGAGTCTVIANQPGDANFGPAPQVTQSTSATKATQTITFSTNAPPGAAYNSNFTVAATATSGDAVVFTSSGVCSNVGATYTMTSGAGSCSVIANQAGDANYSPAPQVTQAVAATQASQTITFTINAPPSASYQSSFTVAASASSGDPVAFTSAGACTNVGATYTMTSGTGTCSVIANQAGDTNYGPAPTVTQFTQATGAGQTITFTTNAPASAAYQSSFTVAASASSGLPVVFTSAGACSNSGATYTMNSGTGTCSVIANQPGNNNYPPAPTVTEFTSATKLSQSITFTLNAPASAPYNSSFSVAASASSGDPVAFTSSGACSNVGATYTMTSGTGTCTVIANQAGDNNYTPAPQMTESAAATKIGQTITFTTKAPAVAPYQGSFTVAASASSGDPVAFTSAGVCTNVGPTYTMTAASGTCTVIANQAGDNNYNPAAQVTETTQAEKAAPTVSFTGAPPTAFYQDSFTLTATTNASTTAVLTATGGDCSISGGVVTMTKGTGTCTMTAKWAADSHYLAASLTQTTTAQKLITTISWPTPAPINYGTPLSGTQLNATATNNNQTVPGTFVYAPASGKVLVAGTQTLTVSFMPTNKTDYSTATDAVTLIVNQINTTTTITATTPVAPKVGKPVKVTFTVTAAAGKPTQTVVVTTTTGETCSAALSGGKGNCTLFFATSGARTLTASYGGDNNDLPSVSVGFPVTVN